MKYIISAAVATVLFLLAGSLSLFEGVPWLSAVVTALLTLALPYLVTKWPTLNIPSLGMGEKPEKSHLVLLWLLPFFVAMTFGLSLFCEWVGSFFGLTLTAYEGQLVFLLFSHALIPAFTEEFCFRHVLPSLLRPLGRQATLWGSALLFAIAHVSPIMMAYALVAGLFLGLLREYTKSPLLPMLFHFCNNGFCLVLMYFKVSSPILAWGVSMAVGVLFLAVMYFTQKETFFGFLSPLFSKAEAKDDANE